MYLINCKEDCDFYLHLLRLNYCFLPIKDDLKNDGRLIEKTIYFTIHGKYDMLVSYKYIIFIEKIFDGIVRKIQKWWKNIYYSPKTKIGIKRFNKSVDDLYINEEIDNQIENKINIDMILYYKDTTQYNDIITKYIYSYDIKILKYIFYNFKNLFVVKN